jgi:hypothetical protein
MKMTRRGLLSLLVIGLVAAAIGGSYAAFFSTTASGANTFSVGTVNIGDNDAGAAMYSLSDQKPGDSVTKCVKVTYTGSLAATVKLYASAVDDVGNYVDLTITPGIGTSSFPDCSGFTADAGGPLYTGTLKAFADARNSYANGLTDFPGTTATKWVTNDSVVYQFTVALQDNNAANGGAAPLSTGSHTFTWEARNQ